MGLFDFLKKDSKENVQQDSSTEVSNVNKEIEKTEQSDNSDIQFGNYKQGSNGEIKPIEWIKIDEENDSVLLISRFCLDIKAFHEPSGEITWEDCTLRKYLNNEFLSSAFNNEEQEKIQNNPNGDKVFLLSKDEVLKYLNNGRGAGATLYAIANGAYSNNTQGNNWWWLRSQSDQKYFADVVSNDCSFTGMAVNSSHVTIRPAIWIKK